MYLIPPQIYTDIRFTQAITGEIEAFVDNLR